MPQLQNAAVRNAATPRKPLRTPTPPTQRSPPADALLLQPPQPIAALFNTADGCAYHVTASPFHGAALRGVCIFTLQRVPLPTAQALELHLTAAADGALPFCTVEGGVTWHDVLVTLTLVDAALRDSVDGWNVQVLGMDRNSGGWQPITPALTAPLEAHYFLQTNVEVLFAHYATDTLHMQATPLLVPNTAAAGVDWKTPPGRSTTTAGCTPPPAPRKCRDGSTENPSTPPLPPPRRLAAEFDESRTPSPPVLERTRVPPSPTALWSFEAFLQQQQRWAARRAELRRQLADAHAAASTGAALDVVRVALQRQRPSLAVEGGDENTDSSGAATWTLSLLEYECQLLSDSLYDLCCRRVTQKKPFTAKLWSECRARMEVMQRRAVKVCHITDGVWNAEVCAERDGAVPAEFPAGWLCLLLVSLRLRCLRHVALIAAAVEGHVASVMQRGTALDEGKDEDPHCAADDAQDARDASSAEFLTTKESLLFECVETVLRLVEVMDEVGAAPEDPRLPHAALPPTLLTIALSLAELAAYLRMDTTTRCFILRALVLVCRVRLQCLAPRGDDAWLPACVTKMRRRVEKKLSGVPLASRAILSLADLDELMGETIVFAAELNHAAADAASGENAHEKESGRGPVLGYTLLRLSTTAALSAAFERGVVLVRMLRKCAAAPKAEKTKCLAARMTRAKKALK